MNEILNFKRLGLLIQKQFVENRKLYFTSILAILGILAVLMFLWITFFSPFYEETSIYVIGIIGLYLTGTIFASTFFAPLNSRNTGLFWMSLPASQLEKFLVALFFNLIVFSLVYVICFFCVKYFAELYIEQIIRRQNISYAKIQWESNTNKFPSYLWNSINIFFFCQAFFLMCSLVFKKYGYLITVILSIGLLYLSLWYFTFIINTFLPAGYTNEFLKVSKEINNNSKQVYGMNNILLEGIVVTLRYLVTPFIWMLAYFKLKEKEI